MQWFLRVFRLRMDVAMSLSTCRTHRLDGLVGISTDLDVFKCRDLNLTGRVSSATASTTDDDVLCLQAPS
jgi:hypothetical protein